MIDWNFLKESFGFTSLRVGQEEILETLLKGKDALGILPTGTGKSFIYQYYGLFTKQKVVVVSPLIALMHDQVHELQLLGEKKAIALTSMLSSREKNWIIHHLQYYQFIFLSPEMLQDQQVMMNLKQQKIGLLVIDEAHCILQWGYDFRPEYLMLGKIKQELQHPLTLALTATATQQMVQEIKDSLGLDEDVYLFSNNSIRENNRIEVIPVDKTDKNQVIVEILQKVSLPVVIYALSIKALEELKFQLQQIFPQLKMDTYHSKRSKEDRQSIQKQFIKNQLDILLATSAFGMGINKKDIHTIIHYHVPANLEDYVQQIGRAGRNGENADVILLYDERDINLMKHRLIEETNPDLLVNILEKDCSLEYFPENQQTLLQLAKHYHYRTEEARAFFEKVFYDKLNRLQVMQQYCQANTCHRYAIEQYFTNKIKKEPENCQQCANCLQKSIFDRKSEIPQSLLPQNDTTKNQDWQEKFHRLFKKM
ncbi:ATP-dependent DNA helicase RecQ [Granulicatella balaenopterae]|uniref:ATP-dependent DNA helicase RecQ n=1 Tax=Granulicatella balaenopterae TaxID=137733 RepID=A0A1H9HTF1_9LACT|nr:RecQ family ATP-dependent DNA helicase [Granulicatella balaenopterae]SEQ65601.1 ATP-dependent DNA helicase RecQ [Granulicatella balaenopterae]